MGIVGWTEAVDSRKSIWGWQEHVIDEPRFHINTRYQHVFHLVRCPIDVISSSITWLDSSLTYLRYNIKHEIEHPPQSITHKHAETDAGIRFRMENWLRWNEHVEMYADRRLRIDEIKTLFGDVCKTLGLETQVDCAGQFMPKVHNARKHLSLKWSDLYRIDKTLTDEIRAKAFAYGFGAECMGDINTSSLVNVPELAFITRGIPGVNSCADTACHDQILWEWDEQTWNYLKIKQWSRNSRAWR